MKIKYEGTPVRTIVFQMQTQMFVYTNQITRIFFREESYLTGT